MMEVYGGWCSFMVKKPKEVLDLGWDGKLPYPTEVSTLLGLTKSDNGEDI